MNARFIIISLAAALAVFSSCKKEEETAKEFMDGGIDLSFPEFVHPGAVYKFDVDTMSTLVRTDGDSIRIGYYFTDNYDNIKDTVRLADGTDVIGEYSYVVPDTLASFEFICAGFSDGHYNTSSSTQYTVVRNGLNGFSSLTNFDIAPEDSVFTDSRDGKSYYIVTIGGVDWMRQNLAWEGAGKSFKASPATADIFGQYYTQSEALTACPSGWYLPSEADWVKLAKDLGCDAAAGELFPDISGKLMENIYFNGQRMWEYWPAVKIDNAARFSAIPAGYAECSDDSYSFNAFGKYAMFWSSDVVGAKGSFRFLYEDRPGVYYGLLEPEETAMSVRCIRK